jgi:hypothetical protein
LPEDLRSTLCRSTIPSVSSATRRPSVTRKTKLSELRRLVRDRKPTEGRARMIRSIQQSMRVEGYDVSAEVVAAAVDRVFGKSRSR